MPFRIIHNDIINMNTDAIVNTSNPLPTYAPGSDSAVYNAAGVELLLPERMKIGPMVPGQAAITPGFHLPAKYIIHTVGPAYIDGFHGEPEALASCYRNSLHIARRKGLSSIAFPLISTGVYGYPKLEAMKIAIAQISDFLMEYEMDVYLVVFDQESRRISDKLFADIDSYIDSHYVKAKLEEEYWLPEEHVEFEEFHNMPLLDASIDAPMDEGCEKKSSSRKSSNKRSSIFGWKSDKKSDKKTVESAVEKEESVAFAGMNLQEILSRKEESFQDMLTRLAEEKQLKSSDIYNAAGISKQLFSKIKNNPKYHPGKKTVFALALGLELNIDQTRDFLLRAGYAINPSDKFDLVMQYFIERKFYDVININIALYEHNLPLLNE